MPCAEYTNFDLQNAYWDGFIQADEVTNLFVWNLKDQCIQAGVNYAGSWHDSKIAARSGLYASMLTSNTPTGLVRFCAQVLFYKGKL